MPGEHSTKILHCEGRGAPVCTFWGVSVCLWTPVPTRGSLGPPRTPCSDPPRLGPRLTVVLNKVGERKAPILLEQFTQLCKVSPVPSHALILLLCPWRPHEGHCGIFPGLSPQGIQVWAGTFSNRSSLHLTTWGLTLLLCRRLPPHPSVLTS